MFFFSYWRASNIYFFFQLFFPRLLFLIIWIWENFRFENRLLTQRRLINNSLNWMLDMVIRVQLGVRQVLHWNSHIVHITLFLLIAFAGLSLCGQGGNVITDCLYCLVLIQRTLLLYRYLLLLSGLQLLNLLYLLHLTHAINRLLLLRGVRQKGYLFFLDLCCCWRDRLWKLEELGLGNGDFVVSDVEFSLLDDPEALVVSLEVNDHLYLLAGFVRLWHL